MTLLLVEALHAQEHAAVAPERVEVAGITVPAGPPRTERAAPGDDLQARVAALPAGSTLVVPAGRWRGPLRIDRPLTLAGEPGAELRGDGTGTVLVVAASDVTVRDLALRAGGKDATRGDAGVVVGADRVVLERIDVAETLMGVDFRMASDCVLRDSRIAGREDLTMGQRGDGIRLWESDRNVIEGNTLAGVRDLVVWYSEDNVVRGNTVTGSRYGTHFMHADRNVVEGNAFLDDVVGVFVMYSTDIRLVANRVEGADGAAGVGLGFKESDAIVATGNRLVGNTTGVYLDGTPHRVGGSARFEDNLLAYNHVGVRLHGAVTGAVFAANDLHENPVPVSVDSRADTSGTTFEGNRWSDYAGYDLDRDGVGDVPHELRAATVTLIGRNPLVAYFNGTLAASLLDLFAAAFPMLAPPPVARDARPVMG
ncbi:MAG: nitrous oxide reductase family maturation protein NosD [Myxococcota bacterium]